ncbi:hypothetical protein [Algoriphagus resistens]|uniref:hypothetical protein n=1 Tax=Algoriphagus resistens TaxID=1750590 RepID=UPI000716A5F7|nr:hypothetical protein [Algoriphagus resistens]
MIFSQLGVAGWTNSAGKQNMIAHWTLSQVRLILFLVPSGNLASVKQIDPGKLDNVSAHSSMREDDGTN